MAIHNSHPSTLAFGLADGCPRCEEHASHPFASLDDVHLEELARRTLRWMSDEPGSFPRTQNETRAMRALESAISWARRLAGLGIEI